MSSLEVKNLTFKLIEEATNNFSPEQKVGSGGYGEVYRGLLDGDEIAVKKLFLVNGLDDKEFLNEFRNLMKVQHPNIVRLLGYYYEIRHRHTEHNGQLVFAQVIERALCFEYMQGGSLARHISDGSCRHDWPTTYKLIKGMCDGLHYLHKGQKEYIYHLDFKPENILLDKNMVPKITDFGLSRLFGSSKTHQTSVLRGTIGFMPPEFINNRIITPKNDVFSLGVIIFQIMVGQEGYNDYCESQSPTRRQDFFEHVQEYWKKRLQSTLGHEFDETDLLGVKKCLEIAMSCVENDRANRPTTMQIIDELKKLEAEIIKVSKKDTKSHIGQEKSDSKDIAVDPSLELRFLFQPKTDISCCLQLTNKANGFMAFNIKTDETKYCAQPSKGIMSACSKRYIIVTLLAQEKAPPNMRCLDVFIVQGTRVNEGFTSEEITEDFLKKATTVDEVTLPIVYVAG